MSHTSMTAHLSAVASVCLIDLTHWRARQRRAGFAITVSAYWIPNLSSALARTPHPSRRLSRCFTLQGIPARQGWWAVPPPCQIRYSVNWHHDEYGIAKATAARFGYTGQMRLAAAAVWRVKMKTTFLLCFAGASLVSCNDHSPPICKQRPQNWFSEQKSEYIFREKISLNIDSSYNINWNGSPINIEEMNSLLQKNSSRDSNSRVHIRISEEDLCNIPDSLVRDIDKYGNCSSRYMCELEILP